MPRKAARATVTRRNMLGGQSLVEAVAELRDKILGTPDRTKPGAL